MAAFKRSTIVLQNSSAILHIDLYGGAITNFHLLKNPINPLSFAFTAEQMPDNNKKGAPYRGHFLCLGRWGEPSAGEMKHGIPDHGHFANMWWEGSDSSLDFLCMGAKSLLEGLAVSRDIHLHSSSPLLKCRERVKNFNPLGRLYNMVQHPTIASPFLDASTVVSCNATVGYPIEEFEQAEKYSVLWRNDFNKSDDCNLAFSETGKTGVHSFIVRKDDEWGWVAAITPGLNLGIAYLWKRQAYPWINIWRHFEEAKIKYRGLEFGTSGMHQPFPVMLLHAKNGLFGETVFEYIDAGEEVTREYYCFLFEPPFGSSQVQDIRLEENILMKFENGQRVEIPCNLF
jgi:hypothetical protein